MGGPGSNCAGLYLMHFCKLAVQFGSLMVDAGHDLQRPS
jgi:hypothetical protein